MASPDKKMTAGKILKTQLGPTWLADVPIILHHSSQLLRVGLRFYCHGAGRSRKRFSPGFKGSGAVWWPCSCADIFEEYCEQSGVLRVSYHHPHVGCLLLWGHGIQCLHVGCCVRKPLQQLRGHMLHLSMFRRLRAGDAFGRRSEPKHC